MILDLWPKARFQISPMLPSEFSISAIEDFFSRKFSNTYPVLFSSGRSAIHGILLLLKAQRQNLLWTPPYSSHCVLNTASFLSTPTGNLEQAKFALVYHQWGYPLKVQFQSEYLIEDSVDSLCVNETPLFPNDGRFEVFSLPKILGCHFGGVVLCKTVDDAKNLRLVRDAKLNFGCIHHLRRLMPATSPSFAYWGNSEPLNGGISKLMQLDIASAIRRWELAVQDRQEKFKILLSLSIRKAPKNTNRLPVCIPIPPSAQARDIAKSFGLLAGERNSLSVTNNQVMTTPALVLAIHQDISVSQVRDFVVQYSKMALGDCK